ncbi:MAG: LacI family DNA-binding transcriptional regulator [Victivallales bacterium]|nr:LacI family DNA-binding transcriptional regulator [Victivallales bacterium]
MTIAEQIAKQVGVCRQSVSAVLNGSRDKVKHETREMILALAKKLNYLPNPNARSMSGHSVKTIGIITPSYPSVISYSQAIAMNREILKRRYKCYIISPLNPPMEREAILEFSARRVDGIIINSIQNLMNYDNCPIPTVVVGAKKEAFEFSVDFAYGMQLALEHLHRTHGHERIVFLCNSVSGNEAKYEAYKAFVERHSLPEFAPLEVCSQDNLVRNVKKLLNRSHVTAFAGTGDMVVGQFVNLLHNMGVRIPEDVAVTGYDATFLSHAGALQLSGVVHPIVELAKRSVSLLFEKIASKDLSKRKPVLIRPTFFKGQTCGCSGLPQNCRLTELQMDAVRYGKDYSQYFEN